MKDPSAIYDSAFFAQHYDQEEEYRAIGKLLYESFGPKDVVDIGCGCAIIIDEMQKLGCDVVGFDGSIHALPNVPITVKRRVHQRDILVDPPALMPRDLVICSEVAEHVEERHAHWLVANLCSLVDRGGTIFFTAALPGQGGHDHVNEQSNAYWIELFHMRERRFQAETTTAIREALRDICPKMTFFARTAMVFR